MSEQQPLMNNKYVNIVLLLLESKSQSFVLIPDAAIAIKYFETTIKRQHNLPLKIDLKIHTSACFLFTQVILKYTLTVRVSRLII